MSGTTSHSDERLRRQKMRSLAIGLGLGALVLLFYVATIVRLGPNALNKGHIGRSPPVAAPATSGSSCSKEGTC